MNALHELARAMGVQRVWRAYGGTTCHVDDCHQNFSRRLAFGIRDLDSGRELDPARRRADVAT